MNPLPRALLAACLAAALAAPAAWAGTLARPAGTEQPRPSFLHELAGHAALSAAVGATVRAPQLAGETVWEGAKIVVGILWTDLRSFWRFIRNRMAFDTRLADNPFFIAHKEAAIVGPRADEAWDLGWAIPEELREPGAWRAAVGSLPPASLRGVRSVPEYGVTFIGWPPVAAAD